MRTSIVYPTRHGRAVALALSAMALAAGAAAPAEAAVVRLGGVTHDSAPGYQVAASGTDRNGQTASASADEVRAQVGGRLVGPNWPPFLTAGFDVYANTQTGGLLGTPYAVQGVRTGADLTFVWRLDGGYAGVSDKQAVRVDAAWGLYNGRQLYGGRFDGLSFIDTLPAAGDFAGRLEGELICRDNGSRYDDDCGSSWNGIGERFVSVRDNSSSGWLAANISVRGSGEDTQASYGIELVQVLVAAEDLLGAGLAVAEGPALGAFGIAAGGEGDARGAMAAAAAPASFIRFASGRTLALTVVGGPQVVPAPASAALAALGLLLMAAVARKRH